MTSIVISFSQSPLVTAKKLTAKRGDHAMVALKLEVPFSGVD